MIGSIWWTLWNTVCLVYVAHWVHICLQKIWHLLIWLENDEGCFSLFDRWCAEIVSSNETFCITGIVQILLLFHLWGGRVWIIYHDVYILLLLEKVPHVMIEETRIGNIESPCLWAVKYQFIPILNWYFTAHRHGLSILPILVSSIITWGTFSRRRRMYTSW